MFEYHFSIYIEVVQGLDNHKQIHAMSGRLHDIDGWFIAIRPFKKAYLG